MREFEHDSSENKVRILHLTSEANPFQTRTWYRDLFALRSMHPAIENIVTVVVCPCYKENNYKGVIEEINKVLPSEHKKVLVVADFNIPANQFEDFEPVREVLSKFDNVELSVSVAFVNRLSPH